MVSGTGTFFFRGYGGLIFWIAFFASVILAEAAANLQIWFLGYWARQYEDPQQTIDAARYLGGYATIILIGMLLIDVHYVINLFGTLRATRITHQKLVQAILGTTLRWLDTTPMGRILSRFTGDMQFIDGQFT